MTSHLRTACALAALAAAPTAHAAATLTGDSRFASSLARLDAPSGRTERLDQRAGDPGANLIANARAGLGFGMETNSVGALNANGYQSSSLLGGPEQFAGARFLASVLVSPILGASDPDASLWGDARSVLDLSFTLDAPAAFSFSLAATLRPDTRFGTLGNGGLSANLFSADGTPVFAFSSDLTNRTRPSTPRFQQEGTLPAGDYRLRLELWGQSNWPTSVSGNVDSTLSVVPAPSAMGLLGLGLLLTGRRRRN